MMKIASVLFALAFLQGTALAKVSQGLIRSTTSGKCWQIYTANIDADNAMGTYMRPRDCVLDEPNQLFRYDDQTKEMGVVGHTKCVDGNVGFDHIFLWTCRSGTASANHAWEFIDGTAAAEMANGIMKSHEDVCAMTSPTHDWITHGNCDTITEHFEFFELVKDTQTGGYTTEGGGAGIPDVPIQIRTGSTSAPTSDPYADVLDVVAPTSKTGSSSGDPHFKTWGGHKYDFHGGCDLVLLQNPQYGNGKGLKIHIRTKISSWWSFIESVVIQIGDQMMELHGGSDGEAPKYWVNGIAGNTDVAEDINMIAMENELEAQFPGFKIHYTKVSSKQHKFRIDLNHAGDAISFQTYKDWVAVNVKANKAANFAGTKGLMGAYPSGQMLSRDGKTLMDAVDFGQEWQVRQNEPMLFHSVEGVQHPMLCAMPEDKSVEQKKQRRLGESLMTQEDAELACARVSPDSFDQCVFDVLATNDKDMAGAY